LAFGLQKIRQQPAGFGFGCLVQSVEYPEMLALGKNFFRKIGYRGVGSAEFKLDPRDGKLKLIELNPRYWQQNALAEKCGMSFPLTDYLELTDRNPKAVLEYRSGIKWVNIYSDIESFREYRQRGELSGMQWLRSLRGEKIYSDLDWDDVLPGLREILVVNVLRRSRRYLEKSLKLQSPPH
jgi:predicted ATP-grasp superfamily ATP-dependent carboligase